jgi:hypothetical protein
MEFVTSWQQEGAEAERRETISALLKLRLGNLDVELEAIIPQLMQLSKAIPSPNLRTARTRTSWGMGFLW